MELTRAKDGMLRETHRYEYNDLPLTHGPKNNINIVSYFNLIMLALSYSRVPLVHERIYCLPYSRWVYLSVML